MVELTDEEDPVIHEEYYCMDVFIVATFTVYTRKPHHLGHEGETHKDLKSQNILIIHPSYLLTLLPSPSIYLHIHSQVPPPQHFSSQGQSVKLSAPISENPHVYQLALLLYDNLRRRQDIEEMISIYTPHTPWLCRYVEWVSFV